MVSDRTSSPESPPSRSDTNSHSTGMAKSTLVPKLTVVTGGLSSPPSPRTNNHTSITKLQEPNAGQPPSISRMEGLRQQLSTRGVPQEAAKLILSSWRTKTNNYNSAWKKWAAWCEPRNEDPFSTSVGSFLGFLAHQFSVGREYRSLNVYRSAVSSTHLPVEGFPIGQHPLISRLLKGAFNECPPKPKYSGTWDVAKVLQYLSSLARNESLTLTLLTKKLAMLLTLVSAHRSSDLVRLSYHVKHEVGMMLENPKEWSLSLSLYFHRKRTYVL